MEKQRPSFLDKAFSKIKEKHGLPFLFLSKKILPLIAVLPLFVGFAVTLLIADNAEIAGVNKVIMISLAVLIGSLFFILTNALSEACGVLLSLHKRAKARNQDDG